MRKDKSLAIKLRQQGKTYNEISKALEIPKGTLSYWFRGRSFEVIKKKIYSQVQKKWSKNITQFNLARTQRVWAKRDKAQKLASLEIGEINSRELFLIGIALYWAEGYKKTKWCISFCNSDPIIIKIMMRFFREVCHIPETKFRLRLQIHPNISELSTKKFWSKITGISLKQFNKTQKIISKSSRLKRSALTLPYGTLHILIFDKDLVDKIKGWIAGLEKIC